LACASSLAKGWAFQQPADEGPPAILARSPTLETGKEIMEPKSARKKVIIVGGVAGGASCAARLRRLDENAEILMVEKGPYVSYANCGLPYHVGDVIEKEASLLVATADTFRLLFNVDVRTNCEAIRISPESKTIELRSVESGEVTSESYDTLVLSPGAPSVRPPLPGIDLPGIFQVRTVPDARAIREWIERGSLFLGGMNKYSGFQTVKPTTRAVVIGGGFIGLETAENLVHRGFDVTLIEMLDQVLAPLDVDMARIVEDYVERHGVHLALNDGVAGFHQAAGGSLEVLTKSGKTHPADIVILALGVRPDTALAKAAGLEIGQRGGIRVDEQMRTNNPDIFAVGDAVEVRDFVTGEWSLIALAGPANRQGRIAADVIAGRNSRFRGTQGTSIIGLFGAAAAWVGASEKTLKRLGDSDYEKIYLYPNSHAGYYPGARPIAMKILFRKSDGRFLGSQAVGEDGVDKRISALAMALQMGATIYDLEEAELCYAPQFGSAKDPVNFAGMVAADIVRGDMPISHWDASESGFLLDVREPAELAVESVPGAVNIPLGQLRARLDELPRHRDILVICRSGQRAYYATRALLQLGFKARTLAGGTLSRYHSYVLVN
jgi:NADPH-dependent 2,4-dienoyl-CoA reductase/sulfur reductase-like enzyme/rhodanese-related sulfurtransferase